MAALNKTETTCTKCGQVKHPRKGYLNLLLSQGLPYVCSSCLANDPVPPMSLGKLGRM